MRCHDFFLLLFLSAFSVHSILVDIVCGLSFKKCDSYYVNFIPKGVGRTDGTDGNMYTSSNNVTHLYNNNLGQYNTDNTRVPNSYIINFFLHCQIGKDLKNIEDYFYYFVFRFARF